MTDRDFHTEGRGQERACPSATFTGNRALEIHEPLLFEIGRPEVSGIDLPELEPYSPRLGEKARRTPLTLPGLSEPETLRHYVRLSRKNTAIDLAMYPLGSCTMKHNARLNEKMARLPRFADLHPLQPLQSVRGALEVVAELAEHLLRLTGMATVTLSPKAGAHGELCGMMAIKAALTERGESRRHVLIPASAHGTNPATAALLGYHVVTIPTQRDGTLALADVVPHLSEDVAALMLTNPNTCGLFEREILQISEALHAKGAFFYCDGANFNALAGKVRPARLGIDALHLNLHKTFSTPHGGGGPGAGPVVFSERLAPFVPLPFVRQSESGPVLVESPSDLQEGEKPFGRMAAFHGQMGMFVRALSYLLSHGYDGLKQATEDAVLAANVIRVGLSDLLTQPFPEQPCMHEVVFDGKRLAEAGVTTHDLAKALIDEGYHPMTVYFPLGIEGAMLIEPTESESRASLELFIATMRDVILRAKAGKGAAFKQAPYYAPLRRLDETRAARQPVLVWSPNHGATKGDDSE